MRSKRILSSLMLIGPSTASAFAGARRQSLSARRPSAFDLQRSILGIRGGDTVDADTVAVGTIGIIGGSPSSSALHSSMGAIADTLQQALVSGLALEGVAALYAVASLVVVPLTWWRTGYSFSVGYGLSVAAMSAALLSFGGGPLSSPPAALAVAGIAYGVRLAAFIFAREKTVESKRKAFEEMDSRPRLKRTPVALGVALLYAFMTSPVMFALRSPTRAGSLARKAQAFFAGLAAFGAILEAVADQHKYEVNRGRKEGDEKFFGPTTWSYGLCRHPNYLGEILFWIGVFAAGSVSFGKSIVAWGCGSVGLWGILSIMLGSSSRLDKKQEEKYAGQPAFDEWRERVGWSVIPLIK